MICPFAISLYSWGMRARVSDMLGKHSIPEAPQPSQFFLGFCLPTSPFQVMYSNDDLTVL